MSLVGSEHKERFEELQQDVNRRDIEWWLFRSNQQEVNEDLKAIVDMIKNDFLVVGPFGHHFVKRDRDNFKDNFYDIPLQHTFADEFINGFEGLAYVATSGDSSILIKTIFDYLRDHRNHAAFCDLKLMAVCVQLAENNEDEYVVVSMDCIEQLKPMAYYDHPPNGRVLQATENLDPPEYSALSLYGQRRCPNVAIHAAVQEATVFYKEYDLGNIDQQQLTEKLYSFFAI